ncbi:MAG: glutamine synthetase III [Anaerofustis sp.]
MNNVPELFGSLVFNETVMREKLPKTIYTKLKKAIETDESLELDVANVVAAAMKDWAIEKGATHFTHWFQPMTGITAEKHDSFISPIGNGEVIMEFSGKELIKGEPDASSFPSGGLRATFEARGYTAWDPSSYAIIKDGVLCIPTAFCSYTGEALDKKTPLLRSMDAINKEAVRILRLLGDTDVAKVTSTVGPEQEYFLIDKKAFTKRRDLVYTGRTLFGAKPPKGQEMEDHYFGTIRTNVADYMRDLNEELWKLGIYAKTEHNEVAPAQHELAPIFSETNIATDHNQLTMEFMKKVADRHGLACLLHEKPFAGINGNGKHNNWSISTDTGINLLDPGDTPWENTRFLLFLAAVIKAVDEHQDLLRLSVASAGNDHRLGANEAPPAIISVFIGDELEKILDAIESGKTYEDTYERIMKTSASVLPNFSKETTDRNRTSPFAFTGNKFEFRMVGGSLSISGPNVILNSIMADALSQFAEVLEKATDIDLACKELVFKTIKEHKRIIFNGNNYAEEWITEAEKRGLLNLKSTPEALPYFIDDKNIKMFTKLGVFTETEIHSRYEILLENYCKTINIEALTMVEMIQKEIIPGTVKYISALTDLAVSKAKLSESMTSVMEKDLIIKLSALCDNLYKKVNQLQTSIMDTKDYDDSLELAKYYRNTIFADMNEVRAIADEIEPLVAKEYWPFPTYGEMLYY